MKIAYRPAPEEVSNPYISQMYKALQNAVGENNVVSLPRARNIWRKNDFNVVWLNWFENFSPDKKEFIKAFIVKFIVLVSLFSRKKKIITTFHNKIPHDSPFPKFNKWFFKFLLKKADKIVILSDESIKYIKEYLGEEGQKKVVKVPHPLYDVSPKVYPVDPKFFNVLFFGLLRPYKNIELIFELAKRNPHIDFTIAGRALDDNYGEKLKKEVEGLKNIKLIIGHQSDEDLDKLIDDASILLLPYNIKSSLNSGVVYYAFSKGINVIIPEIGSVKEFKNKDLIYHYNYKDNDDHLEKLDDILDKVALDYCNYNEFVNNAMILQEEVKQNNSIAAISEIISSSELISD